MSAKSIASVRVSGGHIVVEAPDQDSIHGRGGVTFINGGGVLDLTGCDVYLDRQAAWDLADALNEWADSRTFEQVRRSDT